MKRTDGRAASSNTLAHSRTIRPHDHFDRITLPIKSSKSMASRRRISTGGQVLKISSSAREQEERFTAWVFPINLWGNTNNNLKRNLQCIAIVRNETSLFL